MESIGLLKIAIKQLQNGERTCIGCVVRQVERDLNKIKNKSTIHENFIINMQKQIANTTKSRIQLAMIKNHLYYSKEKENEY